METTGRETSLKMVNGLGFFVVVLVFFQIAPIY